jgi:hypothetical protein
MATYITVRVTLVRQKLTIKSSKNENLQNLGVMRMKPWTIKVLMQELQIKCNVMLFLIYRTTFVAIHFVSL